MTTSWERGRPARTRPGTASLVSPTSINREWRHCSPSAWLMGSPPTGSLPAASIARLARRGISGQSDAPLAKNFVQGVWVRSARGWRGKAGWQEQDAGGTPALPGDALPNTNRARRNTSDFDAIQWRANSSSAHGFDLQRVGRFDGRYGHQRRVWPCSDCVNLEAYALCQLPVGLFFIGDLVHCTDFSDHSRGGGNTAREERPPGSAGVPPAQSLAR